MSKFIKIICILLVFFTINTKCYSYNLNSKDYIIINKISTKINNNIKYKSYNTINNIIEKLKKIKNKYKNNKRITKILEKIIDNLNKKYKNTYNLDWLNININEIKNNWLKWHNEKRIWITKLKYSEKLNNSANLWSKEMSKIWIMTHKRNLNDKNYYNYKKITNWFDNLWIKCKLNKWITNSESIAINYFQCNKKNNCTKNLSNSLKEIFNLYYNEKGSLYPQNAHYKAIVHPWLSKIWLWLTIKKDEYDYYKVYIVTHYCSQLEIK